LIAGLSPEQIALALAATLAAAFVRGLAGFGMAILLVPVLALAVPPAEAVVVANILGLLIGLPELRMMLREGEASARTIALFAVVFTPPGVLALAATPPDVARLLIALVAVGSFVLVLLPQRPAHVPGRGTTMITGTASGLLTGFAGMPGPPVVPYYLGRAIPPQVARASMMLIFLATSVAGCLSAGCAAVPGCPAGQHAGQQGLRQGQRYGLAGLRRFCAGCRRARRAVAAAARLTGQDQRQRAATDD